VTKTIQCATHGTQELTLVCNHTLQSLRDRVARGLRIWRDDEGTICAWCNECDALAEASKAGPGREPLKFQVETLCATCFAPVQALNGGGHWDK
jgi:hypothetical protein